MGQARTLIQLFDKMKASRTNWDSHWDEVARWIMPNMDFAFTQQSGSTTKGEERHNRTFDQTAEHSAELLASALMSFLVSPTQNFFELTTGDITIDKKPENRDYLQKTVEVAHGIIRNTNFDAEIHSGLMSLVTFGTFILRMDDDPDEIIRYEARPPFTHWIWENEKRVVSTVAEKTKMPIRDAFAKYGMEKFGSQAENLAKDLEQEIEIIRIVLDRKSAKMRALDKFDKPFTSFHIWADKEIILKEVGHRTFPYAVPRWMKLAGETYGRSPGMKALPEARYLNQVKRSTIRALQKAVDPPMLITDDSVLGRVNIRPGGLTSVRSNARDNPPIQPIPTNARPDIGEGGMEQSKEEIRKAFYVDQLQLTEKSRMTTTEVNLRDDDRLRLLSPLIGRMNTELLTPIVAKLLDRMQSEGKMPENMPSDIANSGGLGVFFRSQITRAQNLIEAQNVMQWLGAVGQIAQVDPKAAMVVDTEETVRFLGERHGVMEKLMKTPQKVQEQEQAMQQQQQQMEEAELAEKASKTVSNVQK